MYNINANDKDETFYDVGCCVTHLDKAHNVGVWKRVERINNDKVKELVSYYGTYNHFVLVSKSYWSMWPLEFSIVYNGQ